MTHAEEIWNHGCKVFLAAFYARPADESAEAAIDRLAPLHGMSPITARDVVEEDAMKGF